MEKPVKPLSHGLKSPLPLLARLHPHVLGPLGQP